MAEHFTIAAAFGKRYRQVFKVIQTSPAGYQYSQVNEI
jgi:hypothetical protein